MAKRKDTASQDEGDSDDDASMLDVEFEWFDPQEVDFHGLKTLLKQLFDVDQDLVDTSGLANLIVAQPRLGSTVKVSDEVTPEAQHNDPFAFLTVLNLHAHHDKVEVQSLIQYLCKAASQIPSLATVLPPLISPANHSPSSPQVGLILTERFINMPAQIVPPMYTMLLEEMQWALEEGQPYNFTHYLVLSKTYTEVASKLDGGEEGGIVYEGAGGEDATGAAPRKKKQKGPKGASAAATTSTGETFYFHPEDEVLHRFAQGFGSFDYIKATDEGAADSRRAFREAGLRAAGHAVLVEASRFGDAVAAIQAYINGGA